MISHLLYWKQRMKEDLVTKKYSKNIDQKNEFIDVEREKKQLSK
jgi:hypothetical protein